MSEHQAESAKPAAVVPAAVRELGENASATEEVFANGIPLDGWFVQRKLQLGSSSDPLEDEADRAADQVMRMPSAPIIQRKCEECDEERPETLSRMPSFAAMRKCSACEHEDDRLERPGMSFVQRQSIDDGGSLSEDTATRISVTRGSGEPLPHDTRTFMEQRFDADFSGVRIHSEAPDATLADDLHSQAFTVGQDIYFNQGKYAPSGGDGRRLLAHELAHVVQQSPDVRTKRSTPACTAAPAPTVRRKYFAPRDFKVRGTFVHSRVLPLFIDQINPDLFIEVAIPGSNKDWAEAGATGVADLYKAQPHRTIGLQFVEGPEYLRNNTRLRFGGGPYNHQRLSAPQGGRYRPRARRMSEAPRSIELGDLKPGGGAEALLGVSQLNNYTQGIEQTRDDLNTFLAADPGQSDGPASWRVGVTRMSSLTIPSRLVYPTGAGIAMENLAVYEGGYRVVDHTGLAGAMYVYKDPQPGIWSYEWIPDDIPVSTGSRMVNEVLTRLNNDVIPPLTAAAATGVQGKPMVPALSSAPSGKRAVQKKKEKFDDADWKKKHYGPWKVEAEKVIADKSEVQKAQVAETAVDLKKRVPAVKVPVDVQESGKALGKIKHWTRFGGVFGWLREKFDFIFVKVHAFAKSVKQKVQNILKAGGSSGFGSWIMAAAKVVFKIFKLVGAWAVGEVLDKLVNSLAAGIMNNVRKVIDMITPDDVTAKIQEFEALKAKYQAIIEEQEEALIKRFFGDKLEFFEQLHRFEEIASTFSTIVSVVEWGVRILACASPPAIGCLWNLAWSALQWAFSRVMQTCWFTKKVYEPIISEIAIVRDFPAKVAGEVVAVANKHIPVPDGFDPLFMPITVDTAMFRVDCDGGRDGADGLTPERQAILDLVEEMGQDKFRAMLELSLQRGAGPWVLMTAERITAMKDVLAGLEADDIRAVAANESKGMPQPLDDFLKSIKRYTPTETQLRERAAEERKKAAELKEREADGGKGGGGSGGGTGGGTGGGAGGGKGTGVTPEIIRGPLDFDESKAKSTQVGIEELTLSVKKSEIREGTICDAKLTLNDSGNLIVIPLLKVRIDQVRWKLTYGGDDPPTYWITIMEDLYIRYPGGQPQKLKTMKLWETWIKFSAI